MTGHPGNCQTAAVACCLGLALVVCLVTRPQAAWAHFQLNTSIRIVHIERLDSKIRLSMRLPTPLIYADYVAQSPAKPRPDEMPFLRSAEEDGAVVHYLDGSAIHDRPMELAQLVTEGYRLMLRGRELTGEPRALRIHEAQEQPRFSTPTEVATAFTGPTYPQDGKQRYVGDTVLDIQIDYPVANSKGEIRFSSTSSESLPGAAEIANLILDYGAGRRQITRASGPLREPIVLDSSLWRAARTFMVQGIGHIFSGADHVLFVLCLTLGAASLGALLWRVTGFTIGHTITLIAGFFGFVPVAVWFVPVIETAIAASIIFAAIGAMRQNTERLTFAVTALMGLLHGFGFSFVLDNLLGQNSPFLAASLLSFNLGVEIGQVAIVASTLALFLLLSRLRPRLSRLARLAVAGGAMTVGAWWMIERGSLVFAALHTGG